MAKDRVEIEIILKGAQAAKDLKTLARDAASGFKDIKVAAKDAAAQLREIEKAEAYIKRLGAAGKNAAEGLKHMKAEIQGAATESSGLGKKFDALVPTTIAVTTALLAFKGLKDVVKFLGDCGEEAAGQELALKSLHTTLLANKRAYGDFERQVIAQAEAMQKLTGFTDDAVESAATILAPYDAISNDLFPRTLQVTADLARALGVDLPQAAQLMGMASLGMTRGLKQIGIDIDDATFKSIGFAGVLEQVESKVKGQADAYRTTSKGLSDYIKTMWGEVKEQFGVIVNQVLDPFKDAAGQVLSHLAGKLAEWQKGVDLKTWAATAATNFKNLAKAVIDDLIPALTKFSTWLETNLKAVPATFADIKARATALIDVLKVAIDAFGLFWKVSTGQGGKAFAAGDFKKTYDDMIKAIDDIKGINKDVAEDVKDTKDKIEKDPIDVAVDNIMAGKNLDELYNWWADYKTKIEREPIRVRVVRETIVSGEGTTTEYGMQGGGSIPGFGGGDKYPRLLEGGEEVLDKYTARFARQRGILDALRQAAQGGGGGSPQGYFVLDLRGNGKSYQLQVKKDDTADALLEALKHKDLVGG